MVPGAPRSPERTCVACRTARPKGELARLTSSRDGVRYDPAQRLPGRGLYLCPDLDCIDAATRRDAAPLRRALRGAPTDGLEEALEALRHQVPVGTVRSENA